MAIGIGKRDNALTVGGHDPLERVIHDVGNLITAFFFPERDFRCDLGLGDGVVDRFAAGLDHHGGNVIFPCYHHRGIAAYDGAVPIGNCF